MKRAYFLILAIGMFTCCHAAATAQTLQGKKFSDWKALAEDLDPATRASACPALGTLAVESGDLRSDGLKVLLGLLSAQGTGNADVQSAAVKALGVILASGVLDGDVRTDTLSALADIAASPKTKVAAVRIQCAKLVGNSWKATPEKDRDVATILTRAFPRNVDCYNLAYNSDQPVYDAVAEALVKYCLVRNDIAANPMLGKVRYHSCPDEEASLISEPSGSSSINDLARSLESAKTFWDRASIMAGPSKGPPVVVRRIDLGLQCADFACLESAVKALNDIPLPPDQIEFLLRVGSDVNLDGATEPTSCVWGKIAGLDLSSTKLGAKGLARIASLPSVRHLYLSNLKNLDDVALATFLDSKLAREKLRLLDLGNCPNITLFSLSWPENIEKLSLYGTRITDVDLQSLSSLKHLKELNLGNTTISEAGICFVPRDNLEWLNLSNAQVGDAGFCLLSQFPKLKFLNLSYNFIGDDGVRCALAMPEPFARLKQLYLLGNGNSISYDVHTALKNSLPEAYLYDIYFLPTVRTVQK